MKVLLLLSRSLPCFYDYSLSSVSSDTERVSDRGWVGERPGMGWGKGEEKHRQKDKPPKHKTQTANTKHIQKAHTKNRHINIDIYVNVQIDTSILTHVPTRTRTHTV